MSITTFFKNIKSKGKVKTLFLSLFFVVGLICSVYAVKAVETTIAFMSDGGGTRTQMTDDMDQMLLQKLAGWNIDTFNWVGDIAYDNTDGLESSVAFGVSAYGSSTAGQANIPLFLAEGNHEAENASDVITLRKMYATYLGYTPPAVNGGGGWNFSQMPNTYSSTTNYAYDVGDIRMIVVNQYAATSTDALNTTGRVHEEVFNWLKKEIKATTKQHIAVMAHEPAYPVPSQTSGNHIGDSLDADPANRDRFVNLLASYGHVNHFVGHTHISDVYEMRDNSPAEGDARTTTTTLDGGIWELDAGGFGDKAPGGGSNGTYPGIGYLHTNSAAYGDYQIRFVQGTGSPQWAAPTIETVRISDLTRQILVNTWEGAGTGTSTNGLFDMKYYVDYTAAVGANPDWTGSNSGKWWEPAFNASSSAGWISGELGVGYRSDATKPGWINIPIDPFGGLGTTTPQVYSIMQRVTFPATTTSSYSNMTLHLDDDDGVMVWLNGTLILNLTNATVTAPTTGDGAQYFDTVQTATSNGWAGAATSPTFTTYNLSAFKSSLVNGTNTLAIWNINGGSSTSTDLGVAVRLSMSGAVDAVGPVISSVASSTPTPNTATVSWTTNEASDTQVAYGLTTAYGATTTLDASLVTTHSANITGLATSTLYHFRMYSKDASANLTASGDFTFTTPASIPTGPATTTLRQGANGYSGAVDTYINGSSTATNYNSATTLLFDGAAPFTNGLMKWDVSSIPSNATIIGARIAYNVTNNSAANTYTIYRSLVPWVGSEANWASSTASTPWGTAGSLDNADDYSPTALGTFGSAAIAPATSTLNASGIALVQAWVDGSTPNYGFFISRTTTADIDGLQFDSAEAATVNNRPALIINYTLPSGPDATPPVISSIASSSVGTTATITWSTNEAATSTVNYGLTTSYGSSTSSGTATTSHSIQLTGLTASTTYNYQISVWDSSGNLATSSNLTFFVPAPDVTAPIISSIASSTTSSGATITWSTNEAGTTRVVYGTASDTYSGLSTSSVSTTSPSHTLSGLASSTTYYFRVVSTDASNNTATSSENTFRTASTTAIAWEVYIDMADDAVSTKRSTTTNVMNFGGEDGASTSTRKFSDYSATGVTFNLSGTTGFAESTAAEDGTSAEDGTTGTRANPVYPNPSTDATTEFGNKINMAAATSITTAGGTMNYSFTGLDTTKKYTVVWYPTRGRYNNRWSRITLGGATSFTNQSSSGAVATTSPGGGSMANDSVIINTGGNYMNGYVAKWIDIDPATTTISFSQTSISYNGDATAAIYMNAVKLIEQGEVTPDTTGPVISAVATSTTETTATITWTTDEGASSRVVYGTASGTYTASSTSATLVTSHSRNITGLANSTLYYFRVVSGDTAGNISTSSEYTFTTVTPEATSTAWWDASWGKRIKITFDNSAQASDLLEFPVRVALTSSRVNFGDFKADGSDIRFVDANGTTVLSHEIDNWNTATTSNLWVRVPKVNSGSSVDYMYMYYNNPGASSNATTTGTWNSNYKGVWHMNGDPSLASTTLDSSVNAKTGSSSGAMLANQQVAGQIGNAINFTGDDYVTLGAMGALTGRTVSMWIYGNSWVQIGTSPNSLYAFNTAPPTGGNTDIVRITAGGIVAYYNAATLQTSGNVTAVNLSEWHQVTFVSSTTASASYIYQDGVLVGTATGWAPSVGATDILYVGQEIDATVASDFFNGREDEIRVENIARPATWVTAQYKTQADIFNTYAVAESGTDTTAPVISSIASSTGTSTATVTWSTDEAASSSIAFGLTTSYGTNSTSSGTTSHSVSLSELTPATTYHYRVFAADASGNVSTSTDRTFVTAVISDVTPPTVSVTAPAGSATVSGSSVSVTANASDDTAVVGVQFRVDGTTAIGAEDTTSTYGVTWDSTGIADGSHTLIAVARDAAGNYATSTGVTVTVDNTAPIRSSGLPTGSLGSGTTTVTIRLTTDEVALCRYSASSGTAYGSMTAFTNTNSTSHNTNVTGLTDNNTYTYYVKCQDGQGNINATDFSISFSVSADVTPPVISSIASTTDSTTAAITFNTNENARVLVNYGLTSSYGSNTTLTSTGATNHTVNITGLDPLTLYHFQIQVQDLLANIATSSDQTFTTAADATGPGLSAIAATGGTTSGTVTWTTDELASSRVEYGLNTAYGSTTAETDTSPRVTSHSVGISNLSSCAVYHYRVISRDASTNAATSSDQEFTTTGCTGGSGVGANAEQQMATSTGGVLNLLPGGVGIGINVPAGFATSGAFFQAIQLNTPAVVAAAGNPGGLTPVNAYIFRLNALAANNILIADFNATITVVMTYSDADIGLFNEASLWIYRYDGSTWYPLDNCVVDTVLNTVTCTTTQFSDFSLAGTLKPQSAIGATNVGVVGGGSTTEYGYNPWGTPSTPVVLVFTKTLSLNMSHSEVLLLQRVLNADSATRVALTGPGSKGKETNKFGSATKAAVLKFQKKYKLLQTGIVDAPTRTKLNQLYAELYKTKTPVQPKSVGTSKFTKNLKLNDVNAEVLLLQQVLNMDVSTRVAVTGPGSKGKETNKFGSATKVALIKFQIKHKIIKSDKDPYAGTVGPSTRTRLNEILIGR